MKKIEQIKKRLNDLGYQTAIKLFESTDEEEKIRLQERYDTLLDVLNDVCDIENGRLVMEDEDE